MYFAAPRDVSTELSDLLNSPTRLRAYVINHWDKSYAGKILEGQSIRLEGPLAAYVAISKLPEPRLLDAAHIVIDAHEQLGQPIIPNGLPLTKIHHAAFDANLIGIDADFRIHVADRLLEIHDGPFLELGLKTIAGTQIAMPRRPADRPDRDRLALRFEHLRPQRKGNGRGQPLRRDHGLRLVSFPVRPALRR
jgi:hypothetical protein